jgi:hypothetical protein
MGEGAFAMCIFPCRPTQDLLLFSSAGLERRFTDLFSNLETRGAPPQGGGHIGF